VLRASTEYSIVGTDLHGVIEVFNEGAERMLGYRAEEVLGRATPLAFHDPAEIAERAAQLGVPAGFEVFVAAARRDRPETREWIYVDRDGTRFPVSLTVTGMHDEDGALNGFIGIARDVSAEKAALAEQQRLLSRLEAAELEYRTLLESAPDGVIILDEGGRIELVNRQVEALFGYPRTELVGQPVERLVPESFRPTHTQDRERYAHAPDTVALGGGRCVAARRKDGTELPVQISLSPVRIDGRLLITAIVRDATPQRELERQKDEFLANVSHDLRTPLTVIKASINVVLANEPHGTTDAHHRMFANVDEAADRMAALVDDLLELNRLRAGRVVLEPERCDLREVALRTARIIEPLALTRGQRVSVDVPPHPVPVVADVARLERAVLNLLGNAHKHGRAGGDIRISVAGAGEEASLVVADDGPGIPATERERIFERFYRIAEDGLRRPDGSGLGLPIARAMVELHGGRLTLDSASRPGATFRIRLPRRTNRTNRTREEPRT